MKIERRKASPASVDRKDAPYLDVETTTSTATFDESSEDLQGPLTDKVQIQFGIPEIYLYENMCSAADDDEDEDEGNHFGACTPIAGTPSSLSEWFRAKATFQQVAGPQAALKADDESVGSVNSVAYFEPTDFNRSNWESVMNAPTMGLAFVGIAMALTHPLLFVAGLLTAVGTATAASRGYDCVDRGMYAQIWESLFDTTSSLPHDNSINTSTTIVDEEQAAKKSDVLQVDTTAEILNSQEDRKQTIVDEHHGDETSPRKQRIHLLPPSAPHVTLTSDQSGLPPDWIATSFTDLKNHVVTDREFVGLNVIEFVRVFFGDDAPYSFKEFQKKRGDLDIHYGRWSDEVAQGPLSLHPPSTAGDFPLETTAYLSYRTRTLTFKAKTNNSSLLGPAFATTTKVQRLLIISKRCAVLEMKTTLRDIPFADRFLVLERWVLNATKDDHGLYTIFLSISTGVVFTGTCPFESPIKTRSAAAVSDVVNAWCAMATEALKLTEKTKNWRLDNKADEVEGGEFLAGVCRPRACSYQDHGDLSVEMNIDSYLRTSSNTDSPTRSLKRSVSDPLERTRRRSFVSLGRSISQILTRGPKDSPPKSSPKRGI